MGRDVVGVERIRKDDNFFELGGHSMLATAAIARLREELGIDVHVRDVFLHPTVAQLASAIEGRELSVDAADVQRLLDEE